MSTAVSLRAKTMNGFEAFGAIGLMFGRTVTRSFKRPFALGSIAQQVEALGVRSMSIATMTVPEARR